MHPTVSITGIGLVTPLGSAARDTWKSLLSGRFIVDHAAIDLPEINSTGILPVSADWKNTGKLPVLQLANHAAIEAIADACWSRSGAERTALVVGTSKGPIKSWMAGHGIADGLSAVADDLRSLMPFSSSVTLSAACASGLHALIRATMMLQNGEADRALVVAAEASVHPLFLSSFQRLGVLARPAVGCRPFDEEREGFLMSEAAAAICLERDRPGYATIESFGLGGDATHLIGSDPNATTLRRVLHQISGDRRFDLIHAHGTGTVVNDAIELDAIESELTSPSPANAGEGGGEGEFPDRTTFDVRIHPHPDPLPGYRERGEERPSLYSHKGALGHSLGAAGLVAAVINAMAHRHSIVPPNVRTMKPMACERVTISAAAVRRSVKRSAVIASGFGGAVAAVALCKPV